MPLYHFTMMRLAPGSIIEPGNWGRLLRRYENAPGSNGQQFGKVWVLTRELVFELTRIKLPKANSVPSRFESTFSFKDEAHAHVYREANDPHFVQVLHEVELVDPNAPQHEGAVSKSNWPAGGRPFLGDMTQAAQEYWRGEGDGPRELLSASGLRIIRAVD